MKTITQMSRWPTHDQLPYMSSWPNYISFKLQRTLDCGISFKYYAEVRRREELRKNDIFRFVDEPYQFKELFCKESSKLNVAENGRCLKRANKAILKIVPINLSIALSGQCIADRWYTGE